MLGGGFVSSQISNTILEEETEHVNIHQMLYHKQHTPDAVRQAAKVLRKLEKRGLSALVKYTEL